MVKDIDNPLTKRDHDRHWSIVKSLRHVVGGVVVDHQRTVRTTYPPREKTGEVRTDQWMTIVLEVVY